MFFLHLYSNPELVLRKSFILEFSVSLFCHFLKDEKLLRILVTQPFPLSQVKVYVGRSLEKRYDESALVGACPTYTPFPSPPAVTSEAPWKLQSSLNYCTSLKCH